MAKSVKALVEAEVLKWARKSAGLSLEDVASRLKKSIDKIQEWEEGTAKPTIRQLQTLATLYKRPVAVLYLSEPPTEFQPLRDFRRLPGSDAPRESPELIYQIRRTREMREIALDLLAGVVDYPLLKAQASLNDDPEDVGLLVRKTLQIASNDVRAWGSGPYDAFNHWRSAIEDIGILVFQASGIPLSEMRGYSVAEPTLPVIVVNTADTPNGRAFTLLHEFAHLLLRKSGICDMDEDNRPPEEQRIEVFCNAVAGATLVPKDELLNERRVIANKGRLAWSDFDIEELAKYFRVSREVVLRRLLGVKRTSLDFYRTKRAQYAAEYARRSEQGGFAPPSTMAVATAGKPFVRLVLQNYYQEKISLSAVSDYLGVRIKHVPKIEAMVW